MCGIAGLVDFSGADVDLQGLKSMSDALVHRGPDGDGIYHKGPVGLAHRRLAIIDPEGGAQPMRNESGSVILSYNGEIYNFKELRQELQPSFPFATESDTEVVLRAYQQWGIDCISRFRGMFACAIFDAHKGELYLIRDRVGIKPLYYARQGDRFAFASELSALLELSWMRRDISTDAVANYFRYGNVPTPATIYEGIHKLEPGCYLKVDTRDGTVEKRTYWELDIRISELSEEESLERLNAELEETFSIYVRSDVPFGCFLSGGVDSSLVTALMARHVDPPVQTFTIGFEKRDVSELPFAARVSDIVGTDHTEKIVSPQLALDLLSRMARHFGEPFADSSAVPTFYVAQETSRRVKMVLSGDGGDELFAGYSSHETTYRDHRDPLAGIKRALFARIARLGPSSRIGRRAQFLAMDHEGKHFAQREIFAEDELMQLMGGTAVPPRPVVNLSGAEGIDPVTQLQARDFKTYLVDDILTKVDRMSMANSLEVRVPLLDHRIVELAFTLPLETKIHRQPISGHIRSKHLLKKSASRFFPESVLERPKQGFGIPVADWCLGPLMPLMRQNLLSPSSPIFDWIDANYVARLVETLNRGDRSLAGKAWFLLMMSIWFDEVHRR